MGHMAGHMYLTSLRAAQSGDLQKADAIVAAAKTAMAPYRDYRKALADGYEIFLPNVPQPIYHFTKYEYGREARWQFDPLKPTSLLYKKTADSGYQLVGAMYTDRVGATEAELNDRIPLSIARWHQHINFCEAPPGQKAEYFGPNAKFGLRGSITTREACEAAGGVSCPSVRMDGSRLPIRDGSEENLVYRRRQQRPRQYGSLSDAGYEHAVDNDFRS